MVVGEGHPLVTCGRRQVVLPAAHPGGTSAIMIHHDLTGAVDSALFRKHPMNDNPVPVSGGNPEAGTDCGPEADGCMRVHPEESADTGRIGRAVCLAGVAPAIPPPGEPDSGRAPSTEGGSAEGSPRLSGT